VEHFVLNEPNTHNITHSGKLGGKIAGENLTKSWLPNDEKLHKKKQIQQFSDGEGGRWGEYL
jgi:hypothetical protein